MYLYISKSITMNNESYVLTEVVIIFKYTLQSAYVT